MKWSDFDTWLQGKHLQGKPATLTIREIVIEEVYSQTARAKVRVPVCYFRETTKGLVLSPTNQDKLESLFGEDITACNNQRIVVEPVTMQVARQDRIVVRIAGKPTTPAPTKQPAPSTASTTPAAEPTPTA